MCVYKYHISVTSGRFERLSDTTNSLNGLQPQQGSSAEVVVEQVRVRIQQD